MSKNEKEKQADFLTSDTAKSEVVKPAAGDKAKKKPKEKKVGFFAKIGKKLKETFAELKKVSWPTPKKTVKQTGVVIAVVLIFLVVITAFDFGLARLLGLLTSWEL